MPRPVVPIARLAARLLARLVEGDVPVAGSRGRGPRRASREGSRRTPARLELVELLEQHARIDHDAGPDQVDGARLQDARRARGAAPSSRRPRRACGRRCCRPGSAPPDRRASASQSTILPLPSSPHWAPTATSGGHEPSSTSWAAIMWGMPRSASITASSAARVHVDEHGGLARARGPARAACARC